jgi:maltose O-acetyltransferase
LDREHKASDIVIGNNVYIGANSVIRYGVVIGDNATIAIGSVVVDNVLPNQLVGGNPAYPLLA